MRIFFARHGESQANLRHEIANRGLGYGLTRAGRAQARALAERLAGQSIRRIYTSPLLRAIETSVLLAQALDVEYEITPALREFDCGVFEGRSDPAAWQAWEDLAEAWLRQQDWERKAPGGESFNDLRQRFVPFVQGLAATAAPDDCLLCVSHGGLYKMMLAQVLVNVDQAFVERGGFDYTACIVVEARPHGLVCLEWNGNPVIGNEAFQQQKGVKRMRTPEERQPLIESYGRGYELLADALARYPQNMWQYRPALGEWTIHEMVVHIADSEANSYVRCRRFLAEPGSAVLGYDENRWAEKLNYHSQDPAEALELFKWLRRKSYTLVKDLPAPAWKSTIMHSENGLMHMDDWLDVYAGHIPAHVEQMQRVYDDWAAATGSTAGLLRKIDQSWSALQAHLAALSEQQMTELRDSQGWNVRDHITHLAAWEQSIVNLFEDKPRSLALGVAPEKFTTTGIDEINETARRMGLSLDGGQALAELRRSHAHLTAAIGRMADADLSLPLESYFSQARRGDQRPVYQLILLNTNLHFDEHRGWIGSLSGK